MVKRISPLSIVLLLLIVSVGFFGYKAKQRRDAQSNSESTWWNKAKTIAKIKGKIVGKNGTSIKKAIVHFDTHDDAGPENLGIPGHTASRIYSFWTDNEGNFWALDVPDGRYHVSAQEFSFNANQVIGPLWFYPGTIDPKQAEFVEILNSKETEINIGFKDRAPKWTFAVETKEHKPVIQAEIIILSSGEQFSSPKEILRTNEQGVAEYFGAITDPMSVRLGSLPGPYIPTRNESGEIPVELIDLGKPGGKTIFQVEPGQLKVEGKLRFSEMAAENIKSSPLNITFNFTADGLSYVNAEMSNSGFTVQLQPEVKYKTHVIRLAPDYRYCPTKIYSGDRVLAGDDIVGKNGETLQLTVEVKLCGRVLIRAFSPADIIIPVNSEELSPEMFERDFGTIDPPEKSFFLSWGNYLFAVPPGEYQRFDYSRRAPVGGTHFKVGEGLSYFLK